MKTRKAGLALALALALLLTLTACGTQGMPTPDPVPANTYSAEDFVVAGGFLTYDGDGPSYVGVDVSAHQGEIDWERVADAGIDFAMIRAGYRGYTEGGIFQDEYFVQNMEGAIAAGLEVGVYFFSQAVDEEEAVEEARQVLEHYGLDPQRGWSFRRMCFPWAGTRRPSSLRSLSVTFTPEKMEVPGPVFTAEKGRTIAFVHPIDKTRHVLTVQETEWSQLPEEALSWRKEEWDCPRWYESVGCTVEPALPDQNVFLRDRCGGDRPVRRAVPQDGGAGCGSAASIGIIGGADGPTAIFFVADGEGKRHFGGCSSVYFERPDKVEWQLIFRRRPWEAVRLDLELGTQA